MPKAPPFTAENAREMQSRATAVQNARRAARAAATTPQEQLDLRSGTTLSQIDAVDKMLIGCTDPDTLCQLVAAKDRLWSMVLPKAGVMRPKSPKSHRGESQTLPPPVDIN